MMAQIWVKSWKVLIKMFDMLLIALQRKHIAGIYLLYSTMNLTISAISIAEIQLE